MKVVLKSIKDLVDEAIHNHTANKIVRIELNNDEFKDFIKSIPDSPFPHTVKHTRGKYHGSYIQYSGVCVQCVDIKKDKDAVVKVKESETETIHLKPWKKYDEYGR